MPINFYFFLDQELTRYHYSSRCYCWTCCHCSCRCCWV